MHNKNIFFLVTFLLTNALIGMEVQLAKPSNQIFLIPIPKDIKEKIINLVVNQWWYLDKTFMHNGPVNSVCFNPAGDSLATGSNDGLAQIFNIQSGKKTSSFSHKSMLAKLLWSPNEVRSVCFDSSGTLLATGNREGVSKVFNIKSNKTIFSSPYDQSVNSVCFNPSQTLLATGHIDGKTRTYDIKSGKEITCFNHLNRPHSPCYSVNSVCYDPSGKYLVAATDEKIQFLHIESNNMTPSCAYNTKANCVCFNASGDLLAVAESSSRKAFVFNIKSEETIFIIELAKNGYNCFAHSICFDPSEETIALGCGDGKARMVNIKSTTEIISCEHNGSVSSICFDSSGKLFATGSKDNLARIFARYDDYTVEQIQLNNALLTWLSIEKPNKQINTLEKVLADIAKKKIITHPSQLENNKEPVKINEIWATFPEEMQKALWQNITYKIKKYGK